MSALSHTTMTMASIIRGPPITLDEIRVEWLVNPSPKCWTLFLLCFVWLLNHQTSSFSFLLFFYNIFSNWKNSSFKLVKGEYQDDPYSIKKCFIFCYWIGARTIGRDWNEKERFILPRHSATPQFRYTQFLFFCSFVCLRFRHHFII